MAACVQVMTARLPGPDLCGRELPGRKAAQPGGSGSDQLDRATQHQRGGGAFAPGCPPFVVAMGTKIVLQVLVGPWELRDLIAVKEAGPLAPGPLEEGDPRRHEYSGSSAGSPHRAPQTAQPPFHHCPRLLAFVGADVRGPMDPAGGNAHLRPPGSRRGQAPREEGVPPDERLRERPLFATHSRRWERAVSRSCSVSPQAASGGCPSSGRARRTALP